MPGKVCLLGTGRKDNVNPIWLSLHIAIAPRVTDKFPQRVGCDHLALLDLDDVLEPHPVVPEDIPNSFLWPLRQYIGIEASSLPNCDRGRSAFIKLLTDINRSRPNTAASRACMVISTATVQVRNDCQVLHQISLALHKVERRLG